MRGCSKRDISCCHEFIMCWTLIIAGLFRLQCMIILYFHYPLFYNLGIYDCIYISYVCRYIEKGFSPNHNSISCTCYFISTLCPPWAEADTFYQHRNMIQYSQHLHSRQDGDRHRFQSMGHNLNGDILHIPSHYS